MPSALWFSHTVRILQTAAGSVLLACGISALPPAMAAQPAGPDQNPTMGLRAMFLRNSPEEMNLAPALANAPVRGVIMDMGFAQGTVTVLGFPTGDASIYLSTGGGYLGGGGHASIAAAAKRWVKEVEAHTQSLQKAESFPLPTEGRVSLYVLTPQGVLTTQASSEELAQKRHALWPLFYRGQDVVTQYRLVQERKEHASPN